MHSTLRNTLSAIVLTVGIAYATAMPARVLPGTLTDTEAILFWDEPEGEAAKKYDIKVNGRTTASTTLNSYRLSGLTPSTTYRITVDGKTSRHKGEVTFTTAAQAASVDVRDYVAKGDGTTLDTRALQRAIDECPAGGTVEIPDGTYLTGALFVERDSIAIHLSDNATLKAVNNLAHFPLVPSRYEGWGVNTFASVLNLGKLDNNGHRYNNIRIYGGGTIDNQGSILASQQADNLSRMSRSRGLPIINCDNVAIDGITVTNPCTWNVHPLLCNGVTTYGCRIVSAGFGLSNADGWDPDSSADCYLLNSVLDGQDDNIAIKSVEFTDSHGNLISKPSENIRISHCRFIRGGGICIGVELPAGVRNVWITHCTIEHSDRGFQICSRQENQGTGAIEDIHFRDIEVTDTGDWGINLNAWYWIRSYRPGTFTADDVRPIRNISFEDIHIRKTLGNAIQVIGLREQPITDITFRNINIDSAQYEVLLRNCSDIRFENVKLGSRPWVLENADRVSCDRSTSSPAEPCFGIAPTDRHAEFAVKALYSNLRKVMDSGSFIFGAQDATSSGFGWCEREGRSDIERISGRKPQFYSWDFMHIAAPYAHNMADDNRKIRDLTCAAFYEGGINSYCWHAANPVTGGSFYETGDSVVRKILPGGSHHEAFRKMLDQIAAHNRDLVGKDGANIPIIFRPWHEFDGDWFWWSRKYCTPEEFKSLYRFTVDYLRDSCDIHNFLYAFSPDINFESEHDYLEYYPGDEYVDVIALDDYWDFRADEPDAAKARHRLRIISRYAMEHGKIAALTETGQAGLDNHRWFSTRLMSALTDTDGTPIKIAYVATWRNSAPGGFFTPYKGHPATDDFIRFLDNPRVMTMNPYDWLGRFYHFNGL
ncbi:MAG: hypothetical protein K2L49_09980 [Muribaculaceae bacterium]|nr:hypothetical protein [Muribaculaceae bacterium]